MLSALKKKLTGQGEPEKELTPEEELQRQLDLLAELREQEARLNKPYQERLDAVQHTYVDPILKEQADALGELPVQIERVTEQCKTLGREIGRNVFGMWLKAEFVSPKTIADIKGLLGYALDHPGIKEFLSEGKSSVRIKKISAKERKQLELTSEGIH